MSVRRSREEGEGLPDTPTARRSAASSFPYKISVLRLLARDAVRYRFVHMYDSLHLIRLLRNALTLLRESTDQCERDRVTCQLIADLQASLAHPALETRDARDIEPHLGDPGNWPVTELLSA